MPLTECPSQMIEKDMNILRLQLEALSHFSYADPYLLSEDVAAAVSLGAGDAFPPSSRPRLSRRSASREPDSATPHGRLRGAACSTDFSRRSTRRRPPSGESEDWVEMQSADEDHAPTTARSGASASKVDDLKMSPRSDTSGVIRLFVLLGLVSHSKVDNTRFPRQAISWRQLAGTQSLPRICYWTERAELRDQGRGRPSQAPAVHEDGRAA